MIARLLHGFREQRPVIDELADFPCSVPDCPNPSSGWHYDTMGDGQTIGGESRCQEHLEQ